MFVCLTVWMYVADFTVTDLTVLAGPTSGGTALSVVGTSFVNGVVARFGTVNSGSTVFVSATRVAATAPAQAAAGFVAVEVSINNADFSSSGLLFYYYGAHRKMKIVRD